MESAKTLDGRPSGGWCSAEKLLASGWLLAVLWLLAEFWDQGSLGISVTWPAEP
ncbi:hypothetical protein RchiOBHm_Chr3g0486461 [Rosa chinensis]|uniref:Uncharacterized protein n=1 Tax=Rosa chinensis TaxID=74649 RepID=A0A2P6RF88_ROSCH|nr:hypothetical protein RchiOBHm_Chr3g0486461 [Rosa chinensis]